MAATVEFHANPFLVVFRNAASAWAANATWTPLAACRILDAWLIVHGTAAGTVKLTDGTADINDAVTLSGADHTIQSMALINDAYRDLTPSEVLTLVPATSPICDVFVLMAWT